MQAFLLPSINEWYPHKFYLSSGTSILNCHNIRIYYLYYKDGRFTWWIQLAVFRSVIMSLPITFNMTFSCRCPPAIELKICLRPKDQLRSVIFEVNRSIYCVQSYSELIQTNNCVRSSSGLNVDRPIIALNNSRWPFQLKIICK